MQPRLAVHGPRFSGKSHLSKALVERGWQWLNYTDFIKQTLCDALASIGVSLTVEQIHANKEYYRDLIIAFATVIGCDEGFGVDRMVAQIDPNAEGVIFDNVRFLPQWEILKPEGFTLVRITTPERVRLARGKGVGVTKEEFMRLGEMLTEAPLPEQEGELRLSVNGDIEKVLNELTAALLKQAAA